ncbi:cupin domain-containing protein [Halopenitus sp. H-Gu1]|uniref:cupin domain-containing protein n=1 Tax=Halopenitus sp. H-Gu1 TaxID=3242697 RepID=UPI00359EFAF0
MPEIDFDAERAYAADRFSAREAFGSDRAKVVCGYFEPGQFIPVHAPESDLVVSVRTGTGIVREGETAHQVEPGDVVVVEAGIDRGIKADEEGRLEALLVTAPPPTDEEHGPVRRGIKHGEFEPDREA